MSNWQYKVDFSNFYQSDDFTIKEKAHKAAGALAFICKGMMKSRDENVLECSYELEEMVESFKDFDDKL